MRNPRVYEPSVGGRRIRQDMEILLALLNGSISHIAMFGSYISNPHRAGDIDIALFISGITLPEAARRINEAKLSLPVRCRAVNGGYGWAPDKTNPLDLDYHIILLEADSPNSVFMNINKGKLQTIWSRGRRAGPVHYS